MWTECLLGPNANMMVDLVAEKCNFHKFVDQIGKFVEMLEETKGSSKFYLPTNGEYNWDHENSL